MTVELDIVDHNQPVVLVVLVAAVPVEMEHLHQDQQELPVQQVVLVEQFLHFLGP
jgi:hypothetical protein